MILPITKRKLDTEAFMRVLTNDKASTEKMYKALLNIRNQDSKLYTNDDVKKIMEIAKEAIKFVNMRAEGTNDKE